MNPAAVAVRLLAKVLSVTASIVLVASGCLAGDPTDESFRRILIVYQDGSTLYSSIEIAKGLSRGLGAGNLAGAEVYTEFLDSVRFSSPDYLEELAKGLDEKYQTIPPDLVVTVGPAALRFMVDHRDRIASGVPIVFGDVSERTIKNFPPPDDAWGVVSPFDVSKTIDLALRLQPDAERIVVVSGSAEFDRYWQDSARQKLQDRYHDVPVQYLSDLSLDGFLNEVEKLGAETVLLILTVFEDAVGTKHRPRDAASQIARASSAPAYGLLSSYVGTGIVGGEIGTYESIGEDIASVATQVASGVEVPQISYAASLPTVDWRELTRWGIDADRLPENTNRLYYRPTLWEEYRWAIILAGVALLAQSTAIVGLILERRRRRTAELESRHRLLEVIHLNQSATAGALSASIAHELNQPIGAIRNNAEAAEAILRSEAPDIDLVRQILADIRDDDQRAGDIISRLRGLLKKRGEIDWQEFDLNSVVDGALHVLRAEAERRRVTLTANQSPLELPVRADRVHVQQVILNLATNAMDSLLDASEPKRVVLATKLVGGLKVEVSISDNGPGITNNRIDQVFEPFYTTKPAGIGLGLSIARTIVETYGGKIWVDNEPDGGAVFRFVLPLAQR